MSKQGHNEIKRILDFSKNNRIYTELNLLIIKLSATLLNNQRVVKTILKERDAYYTKES